MGRRTKKPERPRLDGSDISVVYDLLTLYGLTVPSDVIASWSTEDRVKVSSWAGQAIASRERNEPPSEKPGVLIEWEKTALELSAEEASPTTTEPTPTENIATEAAAKMLDQQRSAEVEEQLAVIYDVSADSLEEYERQKSQAVRAAIEGAGISRLRYPVTPNVHKTFVASRSGEYMEVSSWFGPGGARVTLTGDEAAIDFFAFDGLTIIESEESEESIAALAILRGETKSLGLFGDATWAFPDGSRYRRLIYPTERQKEVEVRWDLVIPGAMAMNSVTAEARRVAWISDEIEETDDEP